MSKICRKCGLNKSLESFVICDTCKDGRTNECKNCRRERQIQYRRLRGVKQKKILTDKQRQENKKESAKKHRERYKNIRAIRAFEKRLIYHNTIYSKTCKKCNKNKNILLFVKNNDCLDGYSHVCKDCRKVYISNRNQLNEVREKNRLAQIVYRNHNIQKNKNSKSILKFKTCPSCRQQKDSSSFYIDLRLKGGLSNQCIQCTLVNANKIKKRHTRRSIDELSDYYIKNKIIRNIPGAKRKDVTIDQINIKREYIKLIRKIKNYEKKRNAPDII